MTTFLMHAHSVEELPDVDAILHDTGFSMAEVAHDNDRSIVTIPFHPFSRMHDFGLMRRHRSAATGDRPQGYVLVVLVSGVSAIEIRDPGWTRRAQLLAPANAAGRPTWPSVQLPGWNRYGHRRDRHQSDHPSLSAADSRKGPGNRGELTLSAGGDRVGEFRRVPAQAETGPSGRLPEQAVTDPRCRLPLAPQPTGWLARGASRQLFVNFGKRSNDERGADQAFQWT